MKYLDYPELELLSRALTFESAECRVFTRLEAYSCKAVSKERKLMKELEDAYMARQQLYYPDTSASSYSSSSSNSNSTNPHTMMNAASFSSVSSASSAAAHSSSSSNSNDAHSSNHEHHGPVSTSLEDPRTQFTGAFAPLDSPFGRLNDPQARKKLFLLITALNAAFPDHDFSLINPADFRREENPAAVLNSLSTTLLNLRGGSGTPRSFSSLPDGGYAAAAGGMRGAGERGGLSSFSSVQHLGVGSAGGGNASSFGEAGVGTGAGSYVHSTSPIGGGAGAAAAIAKFSGAYSSISASTAAAAAQHPALSSVLDDIMAVGECDVFTFHPDLESDPHASGEPDDDEDDPDAGLIGDFDEEYWSDGEDHDGIAQRSARAGRLGGIGIGDARRRIGGFDTRETTPRASGGGDSAEEEEDMSDEENRAGANHDDDDDEGPIFDEDYQGGFRRAETASSRSSNAAYDDRPRTPVSIRRDYFAIGGSGVRKDDKFYQGGRTAASTAALPQYSLPTNRQAQTAGGVSDEPMDYDVERIPSERAVNDEFYDEDSGDDAAYDSGVGGVLWATYAFFYNRRLKRILFVNVWARRNFGASTASDYGASVNASSSSSFLHSRGGAAGGKPNASHLPSYAFSSALAKKHKSGSSGGGSSAKPMPARSKGAGARLRTTPVPQTPAKRAIERVERGSSSNNNDNGSRSGAASGSAHNGGGGGNDGGEDGKPHRSNLSLTTRRRRARIPSGSPGPSALSPFPHDADVAANATTGNGEHAMGLGKRSRKGAF